MKKLLFLLVLAPSIGICGDINMYQGSAGGTIGIYQTPSNVTIGGSNGVTGSTTSITLAYLGGGSEISAGVESSTACTVVPFNLTLSSWTVIAPPPSVSGSISVTIRKAPVLAFPVFSAMSSGGNPPSLTSSIENAGTPTSWSSTSISQGDVVCGEVTSATSVTRVMVTLWGIR